jgi:hypothetical protein
MPKAETSALGVTDQPEPLNDSTRAALSPELPTALHDDVLVQETARRKSPGEVSGFGSIDQLVPSQDSVSGCSGWFRE